ncbi:histidine phosphatase family protein [Actinomycetota bacterium]
MTSSIQQPAPPSGGKLVLLRHGETEWSRTGRHTGQTDIPLTRRGEALARHSGHLIRHYDWSLVLASPLQRARETARLAGLQPEIDPDLLEWDYGGYEGRTTDEIRAELGYDWNVFTNGVPAGDDSPGETVEEVAARASRVVAKVLPALHDGDVALVGHGHCLRVLAAVFLQQAPRFGASLQLDAGSVSVLEYYRSWPAIHTWNRTPLLPDAEDDEPVDSP